MEGHAQKAKNLLDEVNRELKQAARHSAPAGPFQLKCFSMRTRTALLALVLLMVAAAALLAKRYLHPTASIHAATTTTVAPAQSGTLSPLPVVKIGGVTATVLFSGLIFPREFGSTSWRRSRCPMRIRPSRRFTAVRAPSLEPRSRFSTDPNPI